MTLEPGLRDALCDGLCSVAEQRAHQTNREQAAKIYDRLLHLKNATPEIRAAALRGAVLNRSFDEGFPLLGTRIHGNDHSTVIGYLAGSLSKVSPARKVRILDVFGSGDGDFAGPGALALANDSDPEVRLAALRAVTRMGYSPALAVLVQLAVSDDEKLAGVAKSSLAYFPGSGRNAVIEGMLKSDQAKVRHTAVELIGDGALDHPAALLMKTAETDSDENVRVAALDGLRDYAGMDEFPRLLDRLVKAQSPAEVHAAESALTTLCQQQRTAPGVVVVEKALYGDLPGGPSASVIDQVSRILAAGARSVDATNGNFGDPAPNVPKMLRVDYTENGTPASKTVKEGETLTFSAATAPPALVDALCGAFQLAHGDAKLAALRLLGTAGSPKALDVVHTASAAPATRDAALHVLCDWQTTDALLKIMKLTEISQDSSIKEAALRGAVRLLNQSGDTTTDTVAHYAALMRNARTPEEKKLVLSGLTQIPHAGALGLAVVQFGDASVKAEAVQAATAIANTLGKSAQEDKTFFNGTDLSGWRGDPAVWRVEDGAIVGQTKESSASDALLWSDHDSTDFYLAADIMIEPNTGNAGLQFRAAKTNAPASGYLAGVGQDAWGRLSRGPGHNNLGASDNAEKAVKPGQWNHYEILAVGPALWTAVNGKLGAAIVERRAGASRPGGIAVRLLAGPPQTIRCRIQKVVINPAIKLDGLSANDLIGALQVAEK